jgi:3-hydroxyacyl-[acyl-carrier-protein] dehydratase
VRPPSVPAVAVPLAALTAVDVLSATEVVAVKHIVATDPYLPGHYPGFPIYPGVFVVETARQAVAELVRDTRGAGWSSAVVGLPAARFMAPLLPGDTLRVHVRCEPVGDGELAATVRCTGPGEEPVAHLEMRFALVEEPTDG